ncbi:uncharacterized protein FIBRA_00888 [Fibroporia radiculosa]|uniref:Cytochrome P450 n=1 Tax=Fibroporia radiculosa TaxID=599839 RepID=J4I867_9APHY|nr:uncharacterized protein FIBRA_00888 [Fibroporia radiculosa]CCL98881.1 predicted protein [Fibroporia radiculosa]
MWSTVSLAVATVFLSSLALNYHARLKAVGHLPGFRAAFGSFSLFGAILPTSWFNPGLNWQWLWRKSVYRYYGSRTISSVPFLSGEPLIITGSHEVAEHVLSAPSGYWKAPDSTAALMLWGDNVISSNYDAYKRHRRIVGPAFTGTTYALVARETVKLYHEMVEGEKWDQLTEVCVPAINIFMAKFALGIITRCGFGLPFPWMRDETHEMSFGEALAIVSERNIVRLATPRWAYKLPIQKLREVEEAYLRLSNFMNEFARARKDELSSTTEEVHLREHDLFTRLVMASQAEGRKGLDDSELIGDIFAFMFAGHETTAHVMSATVALLALHEDEQLKVLEQIRELLPGNRDPAFEDFEKLDKVMACFEEAARMFPAGSIVTRDTTQTITLKLSAQNGDRTLVLPPGVRIMIDMVGVHYDPAIFPDPEQFKPSRWYGIPESDLTFFGWGPRACLGRKFAMMEAICLLTMLVRDWNLSPLLEAGDTKDKWRERVLQGSLVGLGFGIRSAPIRLTRR